MDKQNFQPTPKLLTDKSRLQEIYDLRVDVWENSEKSEFVNRQLFPKGWFDDLDDTGFHLFIADDQNKIIAAARLNLFNTLNDFPYYKFISHLNIPAITPFAFYSRLVVDPSFQGNGLSAKLDFSILDLCKTNNAFWVIGLSSDRTELMVTKLGFKNYGSAEINYSELSDRHLINVIIKTFQK